MGSTVSLQPVRAVAALAGIVLVIAACTTASVASVAPSSAAPAASAPDASAPGSAAPTSSATSDGGSGRGGNDDYSYGTPSKAPAPAGAVEVVASSGAVGPYLTGANGATLYTFKPDPANTTTCVDTCAAAWPPFTVASADSVKAGAGVTGALTTFARPEGSLQVAYDGRPLYTFAGDTKPGDTNGQGLGDSWFVAAP